MKLKEYLRIYGMHPIEFAAATGISISTIYRYLSGDVPTVSKILAIEKFTKGKVTSEDFEK